METDRLKSGLAGQYYVAEAPDTLDLAERAELAINGLAGVLNPDRACMPFHRLRGHEFSHCALGPEHDQYTGDQLWGKHIEALLETTAWRIEGVYCCDENVKVVCYHAWDSIVRAQGDHARINLISDPRNHPLLVIPFEVHASGRLIQLPERNVGNLISCRGDS
jgi:hypothetical protein